MAIGTLNGNVAIADHNADFQTLSIRRSQPTLDITAFGQAGASRNKASGTETCVVQAAGFINANPLGVATSETGHVCTFTVDAGRTVTGTFLVRDISYSGSRIGEAWPITFELINASTIGGTV